MSDAHATAPQASADSFDAYALWGSRWGSDPTHLGGPGGVVTWSLVGDGTALSPDIAGDMQSSFGHAVTDATALSSFLYSGFVDQLKAAFAEWSAVANIDFVEVADGGGEVGAGTSGDIRVSGVPADGAGSLLAFTYYPDQGPVSGDVFFDTGDAAFYDPHSFFLVATHEIGHAIGLEHSDDASSIMYPYYNGALTGLTPDDVAGAQAVYGPPDPDAPMVYAVPAGQTALTLLDAPANLIVNANDSGDTITGSPRNEAINGGAGADVIVGGAGDDTMSGGASADHFIFNNGDGNDAVLDFTTGQDVIEIHGYAAANFNQLAPLLTDAGGSTVITLDANDHIALQNVSIAQLDQSDFAFA